jgi:PadR family transcriptional regulator
MRRRPGTLLPLEVAILGTAIELHRGGEPEFHGFFVASRIAEREGARRLTAHGTLYKALERMQRAGLLASRWEDPELATAEGRPRRRLYRVTGSGERALAAAELERAGGALRLRGAAA